MIHGSTGWTTRWSIGTWRRCATCGCEGTSRGVLVAYTPMHGVAGETLLRAFETAALPAPVVVETQFRPDPAFPTVAFPNPEEPGAMDLVIALAREAGAASGAGQ